jgi:hypothetical protein
MATPLAGGNLNREREIEPCAEDGLAISRGRLTKKWLQRIAPGMKSGTRRPLHRQFEEAHCLCSVTECRAAGSGYLFLAFVGHIEISLAVAHCQRLSLGIDKEGTERCAKYGIAQTTAANASNRRSGEGKGQTHATRDPTGHKRALHGYATVGPCLTGPGRDSSCPPFLVLW